MKCLGSIYDSNKFISSDEINREIDKLLGSEGALVSSERDSSPGFFSFRDLDKYVSREVLNDEIDKIVGLDCSLIERYSRILFG